MTYYSGTSKLKYDWRARSKSDWKIHCYDGEQGLVSAMAFARKRAKQDNSTPLVIEITNDGDFNIKSEGYPTLTGRLTPENHKVHVVD
ncbi:hypothetical protein KY331_05920 [Candidatus Woesearchaeota archaeon]|nr:hypothetical protein [Candidatus Woesearchaeota archaeon]